MTNRVGYAVRVVGVALALSASVLPSGAVATAEPTDTPLDVGSYPTTPSAPLGLAGTPEAGARLDGQRMADFVVGPWEVDPALVGAFTNSADVVDGPASLQSELPADLADVGVRHNIISGFASGRQSQDKDLRITVLRFADPQTAAAAAADFAAVAATRVEDGPVTAAPVPGYPDASASSHPVVDDERGPMTYVRAFAAHGQYVIIQRAGTVGGVEDTVALVAATLDRQGPLIDRFPATPPALFPVQELDPTGLLARSLPTDPADTTPEEPGVYSPRAAQHFQDDPLATTPLFADAGVTNWVNGAVTMVETRDAAAAQDIGEYLTGLAAAYGVPAGPIPALPESQCLTLDIPGLPDVRGYCSAVADRYVFESYDSDLTGSEQKVAAQSAILGRR